MATVKKSEEKKHSNAPSVKVVKTTTTESLRTDGLMTEDFSKVPKGTAHNRNQSY